MQTTNNWFLAILIALALSCSYMLDGPDEMQSKQHDADLISQAQAAASEEEQLERAATQVCVKLNGPNYIHRWTVDGKLTCVLRQPEKATT